MPIEQNNLPDGERQEDKTADSAPAHGRLNADDARARNSRSLRNATRKRFHRSLSGKLLLLTILFVMLAEVLIFVPSVSNFRKNWLMERLAAAQIAALAAQAAPGEMVPQRIQAELLKNAQVHAVALKRADLRQLVLQSPMREEVAQHYDLREAPWYRLIMDALYVFIAPPDRLIRVVGQPGFGAGEFIEIVIDEAPLKAASIGFALNILGLSIIISIITAALVYFAITSMLVRPIMRLTDNMVAFSDDPENLNRVIQPGKRGDEIGVAEHELSSMQHQLSGMLQQKTHLAALGLAVSKINHDLRNILSSAQLISDSLGSVDNPTVQRLVPKLVKSLDRAIKLCTDTLKYGRSQESPPERTRFALQHLVREVGDGLGLPRESVVDFRVEMEPTLEIDADRDQLFRVLSNLMRNACEAIEADIAGSPAADTAGNAISVVAQRNGSVVDIVLADTGPGLAPKAREYLFQAFQGSARKGGTGLGLAIAAELVRAHGGTIELMPSRQGTTFQITIPDSVVDLATVQKRSA